MTQEMSVHIAKQPMVLDGSMQSRITATVLGLAAEIEREVHFRCRPRRPNQCARRPSVRGGARCQKSPQLSASVYGRSFGILPSCLGSAPYRWPVHSGWLMGASVRADGSEPSNPVRPPLVHADGVAGGLGFRTSQRGLSAPERWEEAG